MSERKDIYVKAYMVYIGFVILMFVVLFKTVSIQLEGRAWLFVPWYTSFFELVS